MTTAAQRNVTPLCCPSAGKPNWTKQWAGEMKSSCGTTLPIGYSLSLGRKCTTR